MTAKAAPKQNRKDQELAILHQVAQHISSNLELNDLLAQSWRWSSTSRAPIPVSSIYTTSRTTS